MEDNRYDIDEILSQYCSDASGKRERVPELKTTPDEKITYDTVRLTSVEKTTKRGFASVTRRDVCDWLESLVFSVASVIFVMVFVARVNQVFGISMEPTLTEGDRLIVMPLYSSIKYGDIIVLEAENLPNTITGEMGEPIVKRVIGLPGDEIFIEGDSGEVYRNGEKLEELYIAEKIASNKMGNQVYPLKIQDGQIFVMGDNRNHSTDSRITSGDGVFYYVGCVDMGNIIGRAVFRIYPFDSFGVLNP
ncbi:MAG: signal peptidase I [Oscillospiraceae bacterium]|nr:signal peptidase I [Oscillospiraceae bacterium]